MISLHRLLPGALLVCLGACTQGGSAIVDTFRAAVRADTRADRATLDPALRYLRVVANGRPVLLVLGDVDADPAGPVEVWYSAEREVLRLQGGRLAGVAGLTTEWRQVGIPALPGWRELAPGQQWERTRDVMPGYRYGVAETLSVRPVPVPSGTALKDLDPKTLLWFEETLETRHPVADLRLPAARYAVGVEGDTEQVVYAEQCVAPDLCLSWQRWPPR